MLAATLVLAATFGAPTIANDAKPTIDRMFTFYKALPGASVKMAMKLPFPGAPDQVTAYTAIKPNQFTLFTDLTMMDAGELKVISDGTTAWISASNEHAYSEQPAPKTFADLHEVLPMGFAGPIDFFFALMSPDQNKAMFGMMDDVTSGGTKTIDDKTYDVIRMTPGQSEEMMLPPGMTIDLNITQGKQAWLHSATMTMVDPAGQQPPMTLVLSMQDWKVLKAGEGNFVFKPAADDKKVDDVFEMLFAGQEGPDDSALKDMEGQPAPEFSLTDIDGATVSLASLKGKTVILDFFATWCGPCKQGMPVLMDIAKARSNDGVVLFAVDVDEPADKIKSFLTKKGWSLNVLLAGKSKIGKAYKVNGIPHTVVIGPDGVVQMVEVGFMGRAHTEKAINGAIDKAIGKKVVTAE